MTRKKSHFGTFYFIYVLILALAITGLSFYVRSILKEFEAAQPEVTAEKGREQLLQEAVQTGFFEKYGFDKAEYGRFESGIENPARTFTGLLGSEETAVVRSNQPHEETEQYFDIQYKGFTLGRIKLRAVGDMITKLGIFSYRNWELEKVEPVFAPTDYSLSLPKSFTASLNGVEIGETELKSSTGNSNNYELKGLYFYPEDLQISSPEGEKVTSKVKGGRITADVYNYSLTLPSALDLTLNGAPFQGEALQSGMVRYDVVSIQKPELVISDHYGNTINYEGGTKLPMTFADIVVPQTYSVSVDGRGPAAADVLLSENPEISSFRDFAKDVPMLTSYKIAILKDDAAIEIKDGSGSPVELEPGLHSYDLSASKGTDEIPADISSSVDVLEVAHNWSLFLTQDLSFAKLSPSLLNGSSHYSFAKTYSTSIDRAFTSKHVLKNPVFTNDSVRNFRRLSDTVFSVDISFEMNMHLANGLDVANPINDRFYFVYADDTNNGKNDPAWKWAAMIEILAEGE